MALVIQTEQYKTVFTPFERPPQPLTLWTAIPRGLVSLIIDTQLLDVKPVNDDALLNMEAILDPNFGYVMADLNLTITQDRATDWFNIVNLNLQNFYRAPVNISIGLAGNWPFSFKQSSLGNVDRAIAIDNPLPSFPMIAGPNTTGIRIIFSAWNPSNTVSTAGVVNSFMSWWQFDLEQIRKFPINSPIPVHSR